LVRGNSNIRGLPFLETIAWQSEAVEAALQYEIINDGYLFARARMSSITGDRSDDFTPEIFRGDQTTISLGLNLGF